MPQQQQKNSKLIKKILSSTFLTLKNFSEWKDISSCYPKFEKNQVHFQKSKQSLKKIGLYS